MGSTDGILCTYTANHARFFLWFNLYPAVVKEIATMQIFSCRALGYSLRSLVLQAQICVLKISIRSTNFINFGRENFGKIMVFAKGDPNNV